MIQPIRPSQAATLKQAIIPERVVAIVNGLIVKNLRSGHAVVKQDDIVAAIHADATLDGSRIFEDGWLDFEPLYRAAGWSVTYDRPGYNETYPAAFVFEAGVEPC